jgi:hypothetical protein
VVLEGGIHTLVCSFWSDSLRISRSTLRFRSTFSSVSASTDGGAPDRGSLKDRVAAAPFMGDMCSIAQPAGRPRVMSEVMTAAGQTRSAGDSARPAPRLSDMSGELNRVNTRATAPTSLRVTPGGCASFLDACAGCAHDRMGFVDA